MSTILLVEDDISLANWVSEFLAEQDFNVIHIARGDLVLDKIKTESIDLVLLDVMLPGLNGIEVCRLIRQHCQVPIIMLTARADEYDEVIGLEAGADDYVIKPVRPRALLARITRQLSNQQHETPSNNLLIFGELTINQEAKRVTYFDQEIELSSSLFAFLTFLAERAGSVVDRDSVFIALRKREYDGLDRRFDVMLSSLRKVFNDDPLKPRKFKTIWGKGYLFVSDAWGKESQAEQNTNEKER
jgi:DNA-binding response OmpR family regulator